MKDKSKFIILALPRTGSTHLVELLDSHPEISCFREIFKPHPNGTNVFAPETYQYYLHQSWKRLVRSKVGGQSSIRNYLDSLTLKVSGSFGFKIMARHLEANRHLRKYLRHQKYKVILLRRKNLLKQVVSLKHSMTYDIWNSENELEANRIRLEKEDLLWHLKDFTQYSQKMINYFPEAKCLEVYYEDIVGFKKNDVLVQICEFLGVDSDQELSSALQKILGESIEQSVVNYGEVCEYLANTEYEKFLD
ncbi:MAG: sulfotransferase [Reichenbachiella sp.]|uniref:sulfotransferase n=1 Tax=Reichenbachiella sp. TaxID=2184521 RepID=UPI003263435F